VILREPERVFRIVDAVRRALPRAAPLSVKVRLGFDDPAGFPEIVAAVEAAAPQELVIHARTRADGYRPPAYWSHIAEACRDTTLRVVANGEIWSVQDALRARHESGRDDLMLGRGVLCRPDLPRLLSAHDAGATREALAWDEVALLLARYLQQTLAHYPERYAPNPIKQWLGYLRHYYPQAAALFARVKRVNDADAMRQALLAEIPQGAIAA
jgi:tRNA-dihydrouridine synthase C